MQLLCSFYADLRKSCRNAAFTQVCMEAVETQLLRSFYAGLRKSFAKAGGIGICVIAAFPQLLLIVTVFMKLCVKAL